MGVPAAARGVRNRYCSGCDPQLLAEPGVQLVERLRAAMAVGEYVHNFRSDFDGLPSGLVDVSLDDCLNQSAPYFLNQWELYALGRRVCVRASVRVRIGRCSRSRRRRRRRCRLLLCFVIVVVGAVDSVKGVLFVAVGAVDVKGNSSTGRDSVAAAAA